MIVTDLADLGQCTVVLLVLAVAAAASRTPIQISIDEHGGQGQVEIHITMDRSMVDAMRKWTRLNNVQQAEFMAVAVQMLFAELGKCPPENRRSMFRKR